MICFGTLDILGGHRLHHPQTVAPVSTRPIQAIRQKICNDTVTIFEILHMRTYMHNLYSHIGPQYCRISHEKKDKLQWQWQDHRSLVQLI
jgi:hypothetical protein